MSEREYEKLKARIAGDPDAARIVDDPAPRHRSMGSTRRHKYNAKKTEVDGIVFDSKAEARHYVYLRELQAAGEISSLKLQPKFMLQEKFRDREGNAVRAIYYHADFQYTDKNGETVVVDVKGKRTKEFNIKYKLFLRRYPHLKFKMVKAR